MTAFANGRMGAELRASALPRPAKSAPKAGVEPSTPGEPFSGLNPKFTFGHFWAGTVRRGLRHKPFGGAWHFGAVVAGRSGISQWSYASGR